MFNLFESCFFCITPSLKDQRFFMKTINVDVAIIGGGTSGLNARKELNKLGKSWVIIEGGPLGTTCARVGCMPSKVLIAAAERAHDIATAGEFGIDVKENGWSIDGKAVMTRVRRLRDRFVNGVNQAFADMPDEQLIRGYARFEDVTTLRVDEDTRVKAKAVVIASGSRPNLPPVIQNLSKHYLDNSSVFELEDLPKSLVVLGSGVIGLELGQAMHMLGVEVVVLGRQKRITFFKDEEVSAYSNKAFDARLDLQLGAQVHEVTEDEQGVTVKWTNGEGQSYERTFDKLLNAAGRRPNVDTLGLAEAGFKLDAHGMPHWDKRTLQIQDFPVFLAGDANHELSLLHEASDEGRIAGYNAGAYPQMYSTVRRVPMSVAFTSPQMASVGDVDHILNGDEGKDYVSGSVDFANQGRARVMDVNCGMVKLYACPKQGRLLGAQMFGPRMENMAHFIALAIQRNASVAELLTMPFYHPTFEEGLRTALNALDDKLKLRRH